MISFQYYSVLFSSNLQNFKIMVKMEKLPLPSNSYPALAPHFPKQKKEVTIWQHFLITTYRSIKIWPIWCQAISFKQTILIYMIGYKTILRILTC